MRNALQVDDKANTQPNASDFMPPQAASIGDKTRIICVPRSNADQKIKVKTLAGSERSSRRFNPRRVMNGELSRQPNSADEDWVLFVE